MRCSCLPPVPSTITGGAPVERLDPRCPQHGQRTRDSSGTPSWGAGVPLVDLTATVGDLHAHAEQARRNAAAVLANAQQLASAFMAEASYLDSLADTLAGKA